MAEECCDKDSNLPVGIGGQFSPAIDTGVGCGDGSGLDRS